MTLQPKRFLAEVSSPVGSAYDTIHSADLDKTTAVMGPATSALDTIPLFANRTGRLLTDSGLTVTDLLAMVSAPVLLRNPTLTTPANVQDGDAWIEADGVSPNRSLKLQVRDAGETLTLAQITY